MVVVQPYYILPWCTTVVVVSGQTTTKEKCHQRRSVVTLLPSYSCVNLYRVRHRATVVVIVVNQHEHLSDCDSFSHNCVHGIISSHACTNDRKSFRVLSIVRLLDLVSTHPKNHCDNIKIVLKRVEYHVHAKRNTHTHTCRERSSPI